MRKKEEELAPGQEKDKLGESPLQTDVVEEEEESPSINHSLFSSTQHSECAV